MKDQTLKLFLYLLLRDHLSFGKVEKILMESEKMQSQEAIFDGTDKMSVYCDELVERLRK